MNKKLKYTIISFIIFLLLFTTTVIFAKTNDLIIHYIDVGQADSILLELPNNETMLIDAGNNNDGEMLVKYLRERGIKTINYLIGTHPHEDHIGGLDDVIDNFQIGKIYLPEVIHTTKTFEDVLLAIQRKGKKITAAKAGVDIINVADLQIYFLSPINSKYNDLNHYSAVIKLDFLENSFLFTGDAEIINEDEIIKEYNNKLKSNILKVGHHGSDTSSSRNFINKINPDYAIISVGKDNSYGHPSPVVIQRLLNQGIKIYRTDLQGTIIARSDGQKIEFNLAPVNLDSKTESKDIEIKSVNLIDEVVLIKNNSKEEIDLTGWRLLSVNGNQKFLFPKGTLIKPGESLKILSGAKAVIEDDKNLLWTKSYIWNNNGDPAELYDNNNNLISTY